MNISTLQEKNKRPIRLKFTRFLVQRYGMNMMTAYGKLRKGNIHQWQEDGIEHCIRQYAPEYDGPIEAFYESLTRGKTAFAMFMSTQKQMSMKTVFVRFRKFDFSEIEKVGFRHAYNEFFQELKDEIYAENRKEIQA